MIEWWDAKTIYTFREKAQCMVDQYSKYKMQEVNLHVNGRMTQGENIADNGGLKQSFRVHDNVYYPLNSSAEDRAGISTKIQFSGFVGTYIRFQFTGV